MIQKKTEEMSAGKTIKNYKSQAKHFRILAMITKDAKKKKEYEERAKDFENLANAIELRSHDGYETATIPK